jgi:hypothetical protein
MPAAPATLPRYWIHASAYELQWWRIGDAAAEDRLRTQLHDAIQRKLLHLQFVSHAALGRIACDKNAPAGLVEGAQQMRLVAENPHGSSRGIGIAYEHRARIELHQERPATALARPSDGRGMGSGGSTSSAPVRSVNRRDADAR